MKIFGFVIMREFDYDVLTMLERGYRNSMWKLHTELVNIANGPFDPDDPETELRRLREAARDVLGRDLTINPVSTGQQK